MRTHGIRLLLVLAACAPTAIRVAAQHEHHPVPAPAELDPESARFVEEAREATRRFQDLEAAIAAGYRPIGPAMPNMGEHWIKPQIAARPHIRVQEPSFLTYVRVNGSPVLTGVAYTVPVLEGEPMPEPPVPQAEWHFHSGTLEEELLGHGDHTMSEAETPGVRLGMLHAWIWADNPDGVFTADNWALPFVQLGLPVPKALSPQASKAVFLLAGGVAYYAELANMAAGLSEEHQAALHRALTSQAARAGEIVRSGTDQSGRTEQLEAVWSELWLEVRRAVGEEVWGRLESVSQ